MLAAGFVLIVGTSPSWGDESALTVAVLVTGISFPDQQPNGDFIALGEHRVAQQRQLVAELERIGHDTTRRAQAAPLSGILLDPYWRGLSGLYKGSRAAQSRHRIDIVLTQICLWECKWRLVESRDSIRAHGRGRAGQYRSSRQQETKSGRTDVNEQLECNAYHRSQIRDVDNAHAVA